MQNPKRYARICWLLVIVSLLPVSVLQAAWEHPQTYRERRMLVFMSFAPGSRYTEPERLLLYHALLVELAGSNPDVVILKTELEEVPSRFEQTVQLARSREADAWIHVQLLGDMERLVAQGSSFDLLRMQEVGTFELERPFSTGFRDLERGIWADAVRLVQDHYRKYQDAVEVRFVGAPGTILRHIWDEPFEIGESGELSLLLPSPMTYNYRATLRGRYPSSGTFYLQHDPLRIEVPSEAAARFALELFTANFRYLGAGASVYLVPAYLYLRATAVSYAYGLFLVEDFGEEDAVPDFLDGAPLSELALQFGSYLRPPDTLLRPYVSAGTFMRLSHKGGEFKPEASAPYGLLATLGLEYSPNLRTRFFVEYAPRVIAITTREEYLSSTLPKAYLDRSGSPAGYVYSGAYLVRAFELQLGVRRQF